MLRTTRSLASRLRLHLVATGVALLSAGSARAVLAEPHAPAQRVSSTIYAVLPTGEAEAILVVEASATSDETGETRKTRILVAEADRFELLHEIAGFGANSGRWVNEDRLLLGGSRSEEDPYEYRILERRSLDDWQEVWTTEHLPSRYQPDESRPVRFDSAARTFAVLARDDEGRGVLVLGETRQGAEPRTWELPFELGSEFDLLLVQGGLDAAVVLFYGGKVWFFAPTRGRLVELATGGDTYCLQLHWQEAESLAWLQCQNGYHGYDVGMLLRESGRQDPARVPPRYRLEPSDLGLTDLSVLEAVGRDLLVGNTSGGGNNLVRLELGEEGDSEPLDPRAVLLLPVPENQGAQTLPPDGKRPSLVRTARRVAAGAPAAPGSDPEARIPVAQLFRQLPGQYLTVSPDGKWIATVVSEGKTLSEQFKIFPLE